MSEENKKTDTVVNETTPSVADEPKPKQRKSRTKSETKAFSTEQPDETQSDVWVVIKNSKRGIGEVKVFSEEESLIDYDLTKENKYRNCDKNDNGYLGIKCPVN